MPLTDALLKYNRTEVNNALQPFKNGSEYNYPALLKIQDRLPQMAKRNFSETLAMVVIAISKAFEAMNLARPMNSDQIVELAETVLDSSTEDFLALEDVVLFLQGLVRGKYGPLYESMDIPKFMEKFSRKRESDQLSLRSKMPSHISIGSLRIITNDTSRRIQMVMTATLRQVLLIHQ